MFSSTFAESTIRLKTMGKKLGSCIEKARPYYEALELARTSQQECQRAAVQYQRANGTVFSYFCMAVFFLFIVLPSQRHS